MSTTEINTFNEQIAGVGGDGAIIVMAPLHRMTREQAIRHAAWLVVLADATLEEFAVVRAAIANT